MKLTPDYMEKHLRVETNSGRVFTGLCWGFYGSVQCKEEYGRAEDAIEILHDGMSTLLFESEIKAITPQ